MNERVLVDPEEAMKLLNALEFMLGLGRKPVRMLSNKILPGRPSQVSFTRVLSLLNCPESDVSH